MTKLPAKDRTETFFEKVELPARIDELTKIQRAFSRQSYPWRWIKDRKAKLKKQLEQAKYPEEDSNETIS